MVAERRGCYNSVVPHVLSERAEDSASRLKTARIGPPSGRACSEQVAEKRSGQVAQVVERSPEKAGVGGSTPSLATIIPKNLAAQSQNFQPTIQPMILTELAP